MPLRRIKICCIQDLAEAQLAISFGADALGLVSAMPSGVGPITEDEIAQIAIHIPPPIATFLLTCQTDSESIIAQQRRCRCNTIQLVDAVAPQVYSSIRKSCPGISIVQVIHVCDEHSIDEARAAGSHVDAILLDSGNPNLKIKELGGTGRVHDWSLSRQIRDAIRIPLFLAGGLTPANVAKAIEIVDPFGLDLCSGVRTNGKLDRIKLKDFFEAAGR